MSHLFKNLELSEPIQRAISEKGYSQPTPIQEQAVPAILTGKDVLAAAQTGTGKTASFTLPLLEKLSREDIPKGKRIIRTLILTPTRELAMQVNDNVRTYAKHLKVRSHVVFGGVKLNPQIASLRGGTDILVATPGRLLDLISQGVINLSKIKYFVLDEADRMLDMGFIHDIKRIMKKLPHERQNMMFSATYSKEIKELSKNFLKSPVLIEIEPEHKSAKTVQHYVYPVDKPRKTELAIYLIKNSKWNQVLIFTRTKYGANRLSDKLNRADINAAPIHSNKSQNARTKALDDFKKGLLRALVATDIAARGLDIKQLPCVINFELPNVPEDYVHRIGRTGRAGEAGYAVSLVCDEEKKFLKDIEKLLQQSLEVGFAPGFKSGKRNEPKYKDSGKGQAKKKGVKAAKDQNKPKKNPYQPKKAKKKKRVENPLNRPKN